MLAAIYAFLLSSIAFFSFTEDRSVPVAAFRLP